jgi:beta-glucosidase
VYTLIEKYKDVTLVSEERAEDIVRRMTLTEKVGQINQRLYGFKCYEFVDGEFGLTDYFKDEVKRWGGLGILYGLYRADAWSGKSYENGLSGISALKAYNAVQKYVTEHSRFGIPVLMSSECPHGHQALDGYILPVALAMGATFNPQLVRRAFGVCGRQLKQLGVHFALVSLLDVLRDPRWGRSEECFSEDPFLCSRLAAAAVEGCQCDGGVGVVAKHFCAQGACLGGINAAPASIGERELAEIFLPSMEACVEAGAVGCMAAYNEIDGIPCHANPRLLKEILRERLGFKGFVMADGIAVDRLAEMTGDVEKAGALALQSGVDISLWDEGFSRLEKAVEDGLVPQSFVDSAAKRVIAYKIKTGLFDNPFIDDDVAVHFTYENYHQSLDLANESCVLLKNENNVLPFKKYKKVAVIGPNANSVYALCGDYTPPIRGGITILQGLQKTLDAEISYVNGCNIRGGNLNEITAAKKAAEESDAVVLVLGGSSERAYKTEFDSNGAITAGSQVEIDCGEGADIAELSLGGLQNELAEAVYSAGKPVVTVIVEGRPHNINAVSRKTDALLCCFYPGPMGGRAIAEIIAGKTAPSGRLPVSIPRSSGQLPSYYDYKASIGSQRYVDIDKKPLYTFGSGITYTTFSYEFETGDDTVSIKELEHGGKAGFTFKITNTGPADAFAVPQLYIHGQNSSITRRVRELKCFQKILVKSGQKFIVTLTLSFDELAIVGTAMNFAPERGKVDVILSDSGVDYWKGILEVTD